MVDESYVRSLTAAIKGHIKDSEIKAMQDLHDAEVTKAEAPKHWSQLKSWLHEAISQASADLPPDTLQYEEDVPNKITLYCNAGRRVHVTVSFMDVNGKIIAQGGNFSAVFEPQVEASSVFYLLSDSRSHAMRRISIDAIGKHILNAVANYRQV